MVTGPEVTCSNDSGAHPSARRSQARLRVQRERPGADHWGAAATSSGGPLLLGSQTLPRLPISSLYTEQGRGFPAAEGATAARGTGQGKEQEQRREPSSRREPWPMPRGQKGVPGQGWRPTQKGAEAEDRQTRRCRGKRGVGFSNRRPVQAPLQPRPQLGSPVPPLLETIPDPSFFLSSE